MSDDAQPRTLWEPLASRASLRPGTLAVPAVLGSLGQSAALVIVEPGVPLPVSAFLATGYWAACVALLALVSGVPMRWTAREVSAGMVVSASVTGAGLGMLLVTTGWVAAPWTWVEAVVIGSAAVLVVGATIVRARAAYRQSFGQRRQEIASALEQTEAVAGAREAMAAIADDLVESAAAAAREARVRLEGMEEPAAVQAFIESEVRRPAREASHAVHRLSPVPTASASWLQEWRTLPVRPHLVAAFALAGALGIPYVLLIAAPLRGIAGQLVGTAVGLGFAAAVLAASRRWRFDASRVLVAVAVGVFVGMLVSGLLWWGDVGRALLHAVSFMPLALLVALTPAAMSVTAYRRSRSLGELDAEAARCAEYLTAQREALEVDRREIAWLLHTRIQGRATAAQVALAGELGRETAMAILDELAVPSSPGVALRLDTVIQHWERVMDVRVSGSGDLEGEEEAIAALTIDDALANSARHGRAGSAVVAISREADGLLIVVTDDGAVAAAPRPGGLGSVRVAARGGTLTMRSQPGGTEVRITLPADRP